MQAKKRLMIFINLIEGAAVLESYLQGFLTHPDAGDILWGGIPQSMRSFYTAGMLLATAGYFAFTYYILFRLPPRDTRVFDRYGFGIFNVLYTAILIPSALWMPLTFLTVERSIPGFVWLVRLVLGVVGLASLGLLISLLNVEPRQYSWAYRVAIFGCAGFCLQTVILDALVWGSLFRL